MGFSFVRSRCTIAFLDTKAILHTGQALDIGRETSPLIRKIGCAMIAVGYAVVVT